MIRGVMETQLAQALWDVFRTAQPDNRFKKLPPWERLTHTGAMGRGIYAIAVRVWKDRTASEKYTKKLERQYEHARLSYEREKRVFSDFRAETEKMRADITKEVMALADKLSERNETIKQLTRIADHSKVLTAHMEATSAREISLVAQYEGVLVANQTLTHEVEATRSALSESMGNEKKLIDVLDRVTAPAKSC